MVTQQSLAFFQLTAVQLSETRIAKGSTRCPEARMGTTSSIQCLEGM